jgi:AcrR family transcriptional regulator
MPKDISDPRQRLVTTAADLLRRRGLNSTSIRELARHANAPLGSTYHYFPGGKPQLIGEAVTYAGNSICRLLKKELAAGPLPGLKAFLAVWREILLRNDFRAGCPVIAVAADDASGDDAAQPLAAAALALENWQHLLGERLLAAGVAREEAEDLGTLIIAAVEGAILLCRAQRTLTPFDRVARYLERQLGAALP